MDDLEATLGESSAQLEPVVLIQNGLHHDQVGVGVHHHLVGDRRYEDAPSREVLEIVERNSGEVGAQHVADRLGVECAPSRITVTNALRRSRLPDAERAVEPQQHEREPPASPPYAHRPAA